MDIEKEFVDMKAAVSTVAPFLSSLLRKARIILTTSDKVPTAATNTKGEVILNKKFFSQLSFREGTFVVLHEVLHAAFQHPQRGVGKERYLWCLAADGVTNNLLETFVGVPSNLKQGIVNMSSIRWELEYFTKVPDDLEEMSVEEIYELMKKHFPRISGCPACGSHSVRCRRKSGAGRARFRCNKCGKEWEGILGEGKESYKPFDIEEDLVPDGLGENEKEVLQGGLKELYEGTKEERLEKWKEELAKAYMSQKMAGRVPSGLQRIIDRLLKPKIDWKSLLKQALYEGYGKTIVASYSRPSRKHPDLPGIRKFTLPRCHIGFDTSGSISEKELNQFITETWSLAKRFRMKIVATAWDARAYESIEANNANELVRKVSRKLRGGGGTVIKPWLKRVLKNMKRRDIVVVFTDGDIWDIEEGETVRLMKQIASHASVAVFATTHRKIDIRPWHCIKVKV